MSIDKGIIGGLFLKKRIANSTLRRWDEFVAVASTDSRNIKTSRISENLSILYSAGANIYHEKKWEDQKFFTAFAGDLINKSQVRNSLLRSGVLSSENIKSSESELLVCEHNCDNPVDFSYRWSGHYNYCIYEVSEQTVIIGSDYYGTYPLFYINSGSYFVFCTEFEPLLAFSSKILDCNAIAEYLVLGNVLPGKTLIADINLLEIHTRLYVNSSKVRAEKLRPISTGLVVDSEQEAAFGLSYLMKEIAKDLATIQPKNTTIDLSGGLDCRLILSCLDEDQLKNIEFETSFTPPLTEINDRDVILARRIADRMNLDLRITAFPFAELTKVDEFLSHFKRFHYDHVVIKGLMGGELLNGDFLRFIPIEIKELLDLMRDTSFSKLKDCAEFHQIIDWANDRMEAYFQPDFLSELSNPVKSLASSFDKDPYNKTEL